MTSEDPPTPEPQRYHPVQAVFPPADSVTFELERVLASKDFQGSERLSQFLRFAVEETLAGRGDSLKAYSIAVNLLGRPPDFDPDTDTIVRNQAGRVRRALEHYYLTAGVHDQVKISLPSGSYRPLCSFVDGGLKTGESVPQHDPAPVEPVIAIRHFSDLTADGSLSSFAEELSQELVVALTAFEDFRLIPPQVEPVALSPYGRIDTPIQADAARFRLAGSVARSASTAKITAVLHEAGSGETLWSQSYLRELAADNGFEVVRDISRRIAALLADLNGVIACAMNRRSMRAAAEELSFYDGIFRYINTPIRSREQYLESRGALEKTVARAPNHAFAHAILANACIHDFNYMFDTMDRPLDRALALARRAAALDPNSQHAETFLAYAYVQRREYAEFLTHAEQCLKLNPDSCFCSGLMGLCMSVAGDWDRALSLVRTAMDLIPSYPRILHHVPFMDHFRRGELRAALAEARLYNVPGFFWAALLRSAALGSLGQLEEGRAALAELLTSRPDFRQNGRELIRRFVPDDEIGGRLWEGLRESGLSKTQAPAGSC